LTLSARIAEAYTAACLIELDALKPGNVHRYAEGHGMTVADFERSAAVSASALARPGASIGSRILNAVKATRAAVGQNTNLGIVLLSAPLAAAAERNEPNLRVALKSVLEALDLDDARAVFAAIATANPGGLGKAARHDVSTPPTVALLEAMADAAARDLVARQYVTNFADVFGIGAPTFVTATAGGGSTAEAATAVYLAFLSREPDSHIARKFGRKIAEALRDEAASRRDILVNSAPPYEALLAWDTELKARGLNPGTSADLTVASIFAAYLLAMREERLASARQE
jgi:triphosphoribosyl-dephospho-CoA synthase